MTIDVEFLKLRLKAMGNVSLSSVAELSLGIRKVFLNPTYTPINTGNSTKLSVALKLQLN